MEAVSRLRSIPLSLVVAIAVACVGAGCRAAEKAADTTLAVATRRPLVGDISVVAYPGDLYLDPSPDEPGCEVLQGGFMSESDLTYTEVRALPVDCRPGPQKTVKRDYGIFRSPAAAEVTESLQPITVAVGDAELFYVDREDCEHSDDPYCVSAFTLIAVVTLDEPVVADGVEYDVLNLYVDDSVMVEVDMYDTLESLQRG